MNSLNRTEKLSTSASIHILSILPSHRRHARVRESSRNCKHQGLRQKFTDANDAPIIFKDDVLLRKEEKTSTVRYERTTCVQLVYWDARTSMRSLLGVFIDWACQVGYRMMLFFMYVVKLKGLACREHLQLASWSRLIFRSNSLTAGVNRN